MDVATPIDSAFEMVGMGHLVDRINDVFQKAELAETAINEIMPIYPERAEYIWYSFEMFWDDLALFSGYRLELWDAHVRELLHRVGQLPMLNRFERERGTVAEMVLALMNASLETPLKYEYAMAYAWGFEQVFGKDKVNEIFGLSKSFIYTKDVMRVVEAILSKLSRERNYPSDEHVRKQVQRDSQFDAPWKKYKAPGKQQRKVREEVALKKSVPSIA